MSSPDGIAGDSNNNAGAVNNNDAVTSTVGDGNLTTTATTFLATGVGNMAGRASLLALFIIVGFVGNCVLIATIAQSHRLKVFKLNLFILSIAVVNLINCIMNMPMILGNTIKEQWDYGEFLCRFNAFALQLASMVMILSLTLMSLDRFLALKYNDPDAYTAAMTPMRTNLLIVYSWLHAFAFSIPIIIGIVPVKPFPARYLCSIDSGAPIVYLALKSLFTYLIPLVVILAFFIFIIKTAVRERTRRKLSRNAYTEDEYSTTSQLQSEINTAKYVGVVLILWCLFEGPYHMLTAIEQFKNSSVIRESGLDFVYEYPWEVDLSFTWLKLSYAIVLPIITFCWRKEVWQKFKNCVLCRKSNLIVDASPKRKERQKKPAKRAMVPEINKVEMNSNGAFTVPVLFATPEGLHVQTFAKKDGGPGDLSEKETDLEKGLDSSHTDTSVIATKCDVYGSQNFLDLDEGDTSDYDSEIDPFSGSNPISVHTRGSVEENTPQKDIVTVLKEGKLEDSGLVSNTNSKERDKDRHNKKKKKVKEKEIVEEDIDQGISIDDRHDQDSGRGSYGENSLGKKKRQKQSIANRDDTAPNTDKTEDTSRDTSEQTAQHQTEHDTTIEVPPPSDTKKKRKKKKKSQLTEEPAVVAEEEERKPIPALRRPAPPRLNPIQNKDEYMDKISNVSEGSLAFRRHRPLPEVPDKKHKDKHPQRQLSEQPQQTHDAPDPNAFTCSISDSCVATTVSETPTPTPTPTPAPRRPRPKSLVLEEEEEVPNGSLRPSKRKERKRTTSQSDSQTMLLQSSNTSTDLSDLQELNKIIAAKQEVQGQGQGQAQGVTHKQKKTKKKADVKKSESKQDLMDPPRS